MFKYIVLGLMFSGTVTAQTKIKGTYSPDNKTFTTTDNTYWIGDFKEGYAPISNRGYYGFMDSTGNVICKPKYDFILNFSEGLATVKKSGKWGFIDKMGKEVIPLIYDYAGGFSEGLVEIRKSEKLGFIDKTGKEVIPCKYVWVGGFSSESESRA
jgi:hypothetical protein